MKDRIREKGFNISGGSRMPDQSIDFTRMKMGIKTLEDAILNLGSLKKLNSNLSDKETILTALERRDYDTLREASNFYFEVSGIYSRLAVYFAEIYKYDWYVIPQVHKDMDNTKVLNGFYNVINYLENFNVKKTFSEIALKVIKEGVYYGYLIDGEDRPVLQELPAKYCRSRFFANGKPVVEFNMRFFDDSFRDIQQRTKMLQIFPKEFSKGYIAYKEGKLIPQFTGDTTGWFLLDPDYTFKFNINGVDYPVLSNVIPSIIDLHEAQDLDRKKMMQQLLKILIQKLPLDKNGELIFDVEEARDLHNGAVDMLSDKSTGVDILTTFADVEMVDLADKNSSTSKDDLSKVERALFNEVGTSQGLFNTDGNLALEKSVLKDEAFMNGLFYQFEEFLNAVTAKFKNKKITYKVEMLKTTIFNYQKLSDAYKAQATMGYPKMLTQIALGHSQGSILSNMYFENDILNLNELMVPVQTSATLSNNSDKTGKSSNAETDDSTAGRKELPDDEKSTKTLQNLESAN